MSDVPSIAFFCSESIDCFPGISSKFFPMRLIIIIIIIIIIFYQGFLLKHSVSRTRVFYTFYQFHLSSLYHSHDVGLQHELWSLLLHYFLWSTKDVNNSCSLLVHPLHLRILLLLLRRQIP